MSVIAILSDIHANLHALDAVLADVREQGIDRVAFGGDLVGYGAHPRECLQRIRELDAPCVLGNHDYFVYSLRDQEEGLGRAPRTRENPVWAGVLHTIRELGDDDLDWLGSLPMRAALPGAVLAHASLHDVEDWPYLEDAASVTPTLRRLAGLEHPIGFFGHTHHHHLFFDARLSGRPVRTPRGRIYLPEDTCCAITVGSVGQPRDFDARAGYVVWDSRNRLVERVRVPYDAEAAARAIRDASASRLLEGKPNGEFSTGGPGPSGTFVHDPAEVGVPIE
jgi:diadenosine tetraphosphatase ApaH/serine/threonine PP2A family protein phosphatase